MPTPACTQELFKVLVVGDPMVGKTSFVNKYVHNQYWRSYKCTIGVDFAVKTIQWTGTTTIKLQLWDIAGQERFTAMTRAYYKNAHACIVMFDLCSYGSFKNAARWKQDVDRKCVTPDGSPIPCLLIANKSDLKGRQVKRAVVDEFSHEEQFLGWAETSCKYGLMVDKPISCLLAELMRARSAAQSAVDTDDSAHVVQLGKSMQITNDKTSRCACN